MTLGVDGRTNRRRKSGVEEFLAADHHVKTIAFRVILLRLEDPVNISSSHRECPLKLVLFWFGGLVAQTLLGVTIQFVGETIENCEIASFALCLDPIVQVLTENFFDK